LCRRSLRGWRSRWRIKFGNDNGFSPEIHVLDTGSQQRRADIKASQRITVFEGEVAKLGLGLDELNQLLKGRFIVDLDARLPVRGSETDLDLHWNVETRC
jgi:hypothetical protein